MFQKIQLWCKEVLFYLGGITILITGIIYGFTLLSSEKLNLVSSLTANIILFGIIIIFILLGVKRKVNVYDAFIEGAKEGFKVAIKIIPYLVAVLVAIGVFRASGAMDAMIEGLRWVFSSFGSTEFVDALPVAFMKPLSGSGARGLMVDAMNNYGVDSFVGRLACTFQGATDTTFYIIAVYFGSVKIKNTRYAVTAGLLADFAGIIAAIFIAYLFFG
jgi:spore maturation protein SpmB